MAAETVGIRFQAQDDASATLTSMSERIRHMRTTFSELNATMQIAGRAVGIVTGIISGSTRAIMDASAAASGHNGLMEAFAASGKKVEAAFGGIINKSGALTALYEGVSQIADTFADAMNRSSVNGKAFGEVIQTTVVPAIKLAVEVGAKALGALMEIQASVLRQVGRGILTVTALVAPYAAMLPGGKEGVRDTAMYAADLIKAASGYETLAKSAADAGRAVADLNVQFSGGTDIPAPKKKAGKAAADRPFAWSGDAGDQLAIIDAQLKRNEETRAAIKAADDAAWQTSWDETLRREQDLADERVRIELDAQAQMDALRRQSMEASLAFGQQVYGALGSLASQQIAAMGVAVGKFIATGKFSGREFAGGMLQGIGTAAQGVGSFMIGTGLGVEALKHLDGAGAIVAGAGLLALGGVLQGLGAAFGGKGGGGGGGGRGVADVGAAPTFDRGAGAQPERPREVRMVLEFNSAGSSDDVNAAAAVHNLQRARDLGILRVRAVEGIA